MDNQQSAQAVAVQEAWDRPESAARVGEHQLYVTHGVVDTEIAATPIGSAMAPQIERRDRIPAPQQRVAEMSIQATVVSQPVDHADRGGRNTARSPRPGEQRRAIAGTKAMLDVQSPVSCSSPCHAHASITARPLGSCER
jgi:hypothetical protein